MTELLLYIRNFCGYCHRVLEFMKENNIELPMKNISEDPEFAKELESIGGKVQVPCLIIDGKAMYESLDIIEKLKEIFL